MLAFNTAHIQSSSLTLIETIWRGLGLYLVPFLIPSYFSRPILAHPMHLHLAPHRDEIIGISPRHLVSEIVVDNSLDLFSSSSKVGAVAPRMWNSLLTNLKLLRLTTHFINWKRSCWSLYMGNRLISSALWCALGFLVGSLSSLFINLLIEHELNVDKKQRQCNINTSVTVTAWTILWHNLCHCGFSRFVTTPACDRQTNTQTELIPTLAYSVARIKCERTLFPWSRDTYRSQAGSPSSYSCASLRPAGDWRRPRWRPRTTWLRWTDAHVQLANIGIHSSCRNTNGSCARASYHRRGNT